jgi:hypothetical protein
MSIISIVMESTVGDHKATGWIDGFAIMLTCAFVVNAGSITGARARGARACTSLPKRKKSSREKSSTVRDLT